MPPMPSGLPEDDRLLNVQLLRFIREHGNKPSKIEKAYRRALAWRESTLPEMPAQIETIGERWTSAFEMPLGDWATQYYALGMHCGYSNGGHPVKLERIGGINLSDLRKHRDHNRMLKNFYLGLVDCLQRRLDKESVEKGRLQQTYEVFDLEGLSSGMLNFTTINFSRDVLGAFSTHYPSSFSKAAIINTPKAFLSIWNVIAAVLPESVRSKVIILGKDWSAELSADLPEEVLAWISAPDSQLVHAPYLPGEEPYRKPTPPAALAEGGSPSGLPANNIAPAEGDLTLAS